MATQIKITQLTNIGSANLAVTTLLPVVNMAGVPTTQKTTLGNLANVILSQSGGNYAAVGTANIAYSVANAAQPNITSVGTLTNVVVSGNATVNGNITSNGTAYVGNLSTTGDASITTLSVGATANLGAVANVRITGGTNGYVLSTNGSGNLSWVAQSGGGGNGVPGGTNTQVQFNDANSFAGNTGFTFNKTTGIFSSPFLAGNGNGLSNIQGANVSGTVANANLSQYLNVSDVNNNFSYHIVLSAGSGDKSLHIDADDNLQYNPSDGTLTAVRVDATYVLADLQFSNGYPAANVTGLGNIATINLTGSNANVLYGNGVFAAVAGGNANTGNVTFSDQVVIGTGSNDGTGGLYLAPGNASIANSAVQYLRVRGGDAPTHIHLDTGNNQYYDQYFGDDAKYVKLELGDAGNVVVGTDDAAGNSYNWTFTSGGNLILANGNSVIQSIANSSLDPTLPNVSTMVLTPDANYNSQVLVLDPTAPGHIHLRAYAFSNIDAPSANLFLGGEDTAFEVTSGANNQAVIHSNGKAWTFGNDGNISSDTLTFTTTFANVKTVEYQTAGVWDLYVEDGITGSNTASSRLNVSFKDNLIDKPQVYIENTKESDGIALRWTFDENGNLNFPRDVAGNIDPILSIVGGATPTIVSTAASLAGPANLAIQSNYLNLSGFTGEKITFFPDDGLISTDFDMVLTTNVGGGNTYTWTLDATGNLNLPGNLVIAGNANVFGTNSSLLQTTDNRPLIALSSGANGAVSSLWVEDIGNVGTSNIAAVYANPTSGSKIVRIAVGQNGGGGPNLWDFGATGNLTLPTGGHIIVSGGLVSSGASPAPSINGFSITNSIGISGNGNIAGNNISATGNISANNFTGNGGTLSNVATKVEGSWTLASGTNTVNISVPLNGTYAIWVNGNIPNGIITYTATAVITNTNVPVLGEQYAWYYALGNALVFTTIPDQFVGTVGSISTVNTYAGNTANVFTFGITNNSGNTAVVNYGYTKL